MFKTFCSGNLVFGGKYSGPGVDTDLGVTAGTAFTCLVDLKTDKFLK